MKPKNFVQRNFKALIRTLTSTESFGITIPKQYFKDKTFMAGEVVEVVILKEVKRDEHKRIKKLLPGKR